jgi:hypothetical protein
MPLPGVVPGAADADARRRVQRVLGLEQKRDTFAERDVARRASDRRRVAIDVSFCRRLREASRGNRGAGFGDGDGERRDRVDACVAEVVAGGEAPRSVVERANAVTHGAIVAQRDDDAVAHLDAFAAPVFEADVRVGGAARVRRVQRPLRGRFK